MPGMCKYRLTLSSEQSYEVIIVITPIAHTRNENRLGEVIELTEDHAISQLWSQDFHPALGDSKAFLFHWCRELGSWNLEYSIPYRRHCTFPTCFLRWLRIKYCCSSSEWGWNKKCTVSQILLSPTVPLWAWNSLQFKPQTQTLSCSPLNYTIAWNLSSDSGHQRTVLWEGLLKAPQKQRWVEQVSQE